ncbi:MAG: nucleotide pyrophosphohydrolase [Rikenellaceae bacterium]|nr:nucleotide pyrophosphohydrolase [Rikenellaceae bacterium]
MTIKEMQMLVDGWITKEGVRYFDPLTNMLQLTEEVGELARVVSRTYGEQSFKEGERRSLGDELADVLWVVTCLANQCGVDLEAELIAGLDKRNSRDRDRHKNNAKLTGR